MTTAGPGVPDAPAAGYSQPRSVTPSWPGNSTSSRGLMSTPSCGHAAVDGDDRAVDERRALRRERDDHVRDLLGSTITADWDVAPRELLSIGLGDRFRHAGQRRPGAHAV